MLRNHQLLKKFCDSSNSIIYIASRLFDIEEKVKAELLEDAVLKGIKDAFRGKNIPLPERKLTYSPFKDADQERLKVNNKTQVLYNMDIEKLNSTEIIIAYYDGLAKDEGISFELGYAFYRKAKLVLISTDFYDLRMSNGFKYPFDPLVLAATSKLIRVPYLLMNKKNFHSNLIATRLKVLGFVSEIVRNILLNYTISKDNLTIKKKKKNINPTIFVDLGGGLFEWQNILMNQLKKVCAHKNIRVLESSRYKQLKKLSPKNYLKRILCNDISSINKSDLVITCCDFHECDPGVAFIQGYSRGAGKEVWMYNSKNQQISAAQKYVSSRNLMLDYSANKVFSSFQSLLTAIKHQIN